MKRLLSCLLVLGLLVCLSGCGLFGGGVNYDFSYLNSEKYSAGNTLIEQSEGLQNLHISWYKGDVTIKTHKEDYILIDELANGVLEDSHRVHHNYQVDPQGVGTLFIEYGASGVKDYTDEMQKDLIVTIPEYNNYYIGVTSGYANITVDTDDYENTLRKLSITTDCGAVHANIYHANVVQIAGYGVDAGDSDNRVYELHAVGTIHTLGFNSSYAKIILTADTVNGMDNVGSVFETTHITINHAKDVKLSGSRSEYFVYLKEFTSLTIEGRERPIHIYLPEDTQFTLDITRVEYFEGEEDRVSDSVVIDFDGVTRISDTKYVVGNGEKSIHITTYHDIEISPLQG